LLANSVYLYGVSINTAQALENSDRTALPVEFCRGQGCEFESRQACHLSHT